MLPELKKEIERIVAKNADELTPSEIGFLRARRSYLNKEQIIKFAQHFRGLPKTDNVEPTKHEDINQPEVANANVEVKAEPKKETSTVTTIGDDASQYDPDYVAGN